jgi:hypothetical protein
VFIVSQRGDEHTGNIRPRHRSRRLSSAQQSVPLDLNRKEPTRNTWKGLIIGALSGAAVGLSVEALEGSTRLAARSAKRATGTLVEGLPVVVDKTKHVAGKAGDAIAGKASAHH